MLEFRILGSMEAECGGRPVPLGWPYERRVLAALLLDAGRVVPVRQLVETVWDDPPATAGKQARNAVSKLRSALGEADAGDLIVTEPGGYRLAADRCTVDARVFTAGVTAAGQAMTGGKAADAVALLRSALALWRGPALAGLTGRGLELAAAAWDERRVAALEMCYGLELALGRHQVIAGELADLAAGNPLREKLAGQYMLALYRCGRQADALAVYRRTRDLLTDQTGLDPGPELRQLQQQILAADPALLLPQHAGPTPAGSGGSLASAAAGAAGVAPAAPQVRHSLPGDTAAFTGRGGELDHIMTAVKSTAGSGGPVAVHAIGGLPGAGKTALAVHAAHVLAARFPDRQLFIDLHAHTPGRDPVRPEDALAGLLATTGVDARFLPGDLEGRAGLWRDRMAGQRALLVLDNAASSGQVAPLLPGGGCLVLVTSRRHLGDLPGPVRQVPLGALPPQEAAQMFIRLAPRAAGDRDRVAELAALAGFLPLAVCLLARVLARHPSWTLADLAGETRARLLTLAAENKSVAAAFAVSYRYLDPGRQRFFRLLGLHPGATTDAYAAAALAGTGLDEAAGHLEALHGEGLVTETGYHRYGMHDLIRRYARDLAAADSPDGSQRALDRLLDYYQHTAALARTHIVLPARPGPGPSIPPGLEVPVLEDRGQALAWALAERASMLACLDLAARTGQHARVVALTAGLAAVARDGPRAEAVARHAAAVTAARKLDDRAGEANALTDLGNAHWRTSDLPAAAQALQQALGIYRDLGDRAGEAGALTDLGFVRHCMSEYPAGAHALQQALGIYRDLSDRAGEAYALCELATAGEYPAAAQVLEEALAIYRDLGDRAGEAGTLAGLGFLRHCMSEHPAGAQALQQSLAIYRDLGDRTGEAGALCHLGIMGRLTGEYPGAAQALEEALAICRDLGDRTGEAGTLISLGIVRRLTGHYPAAAQALEEALAICRDQGDRDGEAGALCHLGIVRRLTGHYPAAAQALQDALGICRDAGIQHGESETLSELGTLHQIRGDLARAREHHQQALDLARAISSRRDEARALAGLARCAAAAGSTTQAKMLLRQAHQIIQQVGGAEILDTLAEVDALIREASA